MTKIINGTECRYHHSATHRGYHTVKCDTIERYKGRYGTGYIIRRNDPRTTNYHTVIYYISTNAE